MTAETPEDIVKRHYATDEHLRVRQQTHEKYTVPDRSFAAWVLERLTWRGDEQVLDVGCGTGLYYKALVALAPEVGYVGLDMMSAMLAHHPGVELKRPLAQGDVQHLPFPSASFDVVMANHMLYHVEDIDAALQELRRVLKPGGLLIAAANSINTMPELQVLMRRAIVLLTRSGAAQVRAPDLPSDRFALENGTRLLSQYFYGVVRHDLPSALVFPAVDPAMAYLESTRDLRETTLPPDVVWDDVMMIMRQQINQLIKHLGELVISKQAGVLIASDSGGFISDFIAHRNGAAASSDHE